MEINIKWNICRVCLVEDKKPEMSSEVEPMRHIFDDDKHLATQIYECSGITMTSDDNLPAKICKKCLTMIKCAVNFRKTCRASDTYLHSILQRTKSATSLLKQELPSAEDLLIEAIPNDSTSKIKDTDDLSVVGQRILKRQGTKQLNRDPNKFYKYTNSREIKCNRNNLIENEEVEINEDHLNSIVEQEEKLDHSELFPNQMFYVEKDDNIDDQNENEKVHIDYKSLRLQYFQRGEEEEEEINMKEDQGTELQNVQETHKLDYFTNNKNENILQAETDQENVDEDNIESYEQEEDNEQFISQEEESQQEMLQNFKSNMDENQASVSSTVFATADENDNDKELQEDDSTPSTEKNEIQTEYIIEEYLIDDNVKDITNSKSPKIKAKKQEVQLEHSKVFTNNSLLTKSNSQIKVWICNICGNHFNNRILLNAHLKVHRQEKNHECELCFKRFITACNLQAHMRVHTREKPFECKYCERRFSDRSSHLRHERTHTNEKPFQCKECGKCFSLATTLKKHLKVHTGERLYRCDICAKSFKLIHQLKAHTNTTLHKAIEQLIQPEQHS